MVTWKAAKSKLWQTSARHEHHVGSSQRRLSDIGRLSFFCWDGGIFWLIFFYIFSSRARLNWSAWITRYYHRLLPPPWTLDWTPFFFFLTSSVSAAVHIAKMLLYILDCVWLSWFPGVGHFAPSKWQQIHEFWQNGIERTLSTPLSRCHFAWLREDAPFQLPTTCKIKKRTRQNKDGTTSTDYISLISFSLVK